MREKTVWEGDKIRELEGYGRREGVGGDKVWDSTGRKVGDGRVDRMTKR